MNLRRLKAVMSARVNSNHSPFLRRSANRVCQYRSIPVGSSVRISRATRALGATVGGSLLILGVAELITHLDEPLSLFFWLPALWGGGALVLVGVFRATARAWLSVVLVVLGAFLGLLASAWTVLMPVLALTLVVLTIVRARRQALVPVETNA
jgi:hypothetical protein